jgi:hypothetical protein
MKDFIVPDMTTGANVQIEIIGGRTAVTISGSFAGDKRPRLRYLAGFYPAGVVVAVQVVSGRAVAEALLNPALPAQRDALERLARQDGVAVTLPDGRTVTAVQNRLIRNDVIAILRRIDGHLPYCVRVDWPAAVAEFTAV